ncbi:inositol-3-phosphate synthase [Saccharopolyspora endophytica]|uniref:Inositol-3-phosphate synthase n=1 Tax=Saccharopolyspora endophytica TaxID=543886 RepID=A0ABS5DLV9_9PSEU|nr:inositol-3-phosphate synthase [Saccharopolyspora endophytica]MBQ0927067.1 inositol-3-phosphate synthase [Saccharopolyspora endophytica]
MAPRTGLWFIGARGSVATTATVGALAMTTGLAPRTGCVADLPEVAVAAPPGVDDLLIGGHDVVGDALPKRAEALAAGGVFGHELARAVHSGLVEVDARIRPGITSNGDFQRDAIEQVSRDVAGFRAAHGLDRVIVIDVSTTEPPLELTPEHRDLDALDRALAAGESPLPASGVYAYAALRAGCPFVAFTPSPGPRLPAIDQLARRTQLPWAGTDGKTGETLIKSALAPMFATRALRVRSWASYNLLGGGDGQSLADPVTAESKTRSKNKGLGSILGHPVDGPMHIDYLPDLGDWKTAWDLVSFDGFLGTKMSMQFTWQGCDSALAAPLVLDLARLMARAHRAGAVGAVEALGFFFKDPAGDTPHDLAGQWRALLDWCGQIGSAEQR